jgi:hypothetical protein
MVARSNMRDTGTRLQNYPAAFMPEQVREKFVVPLGAGNLADLRAANSGAMDLYQHLATFQSGNFDIVQHQRRS